MKLMKLLDVLEIKLPEYSKQDLIASLSLGLGAAGHNVQCFGEEISKQYTFDRRGFTTHQIKLKGESYIGIAESILAATGKTFPKKLVRLCDVEEEKITDSTIKVTVRYELYKF